MSLTRHARFLMSSTENRERYRARESARADYHQRAQLLSSLRFPRTSRALVCLSNPAADRIVVLALPVPLMDTYDSLFEPYVMSGILVAGHVSLRWAARR